MCNCPILRRKGVDGETGGCMMWHAVSVSRAWPATMKARKELYEMATHGI